MLIEAVKADDGILIHLATEEFEHLFDWKRVKEEVKVIQPLLYADKGDTIKVVSVHAKSCRGAMTRYIIQNRLTQPSDILGFELEGLVRRRCAAEFPWVYSAPPSSLMKLAPSPVSWDQRKSR